MKDANETATDGLDFTIRPKRCARQDTCGIFRDVIIGLMAILVQQERIRISERTKAGLARVRSHGKKLERPPLKDLSNASRTTIWRRRKSAASSSLIYMQPGV